VDSIAIITTTYYPDNDAGRRRYRIAMDCIKSWYKHLKYDGDMELFIADDGSEIVTNYNSRQERKGIGTSLNTAFQEVLKDTDIALYIVDDWLLHQNIDITQWVKLLRNNEGIGMVRIGPPHPDLTGTVKLFEEGWALVINKHNYAYGMRPAIYHKRLFEAYEWFEEGISCWECERLFNEHLCASEGPDIVYALPNPWEHVDILPLGQIVPEG